MKKHTLVKRAAVLLAILSLTACASAKSTSTQSAYETAASAYDMADTESYEAAYEEAYEADLYMDSDIEVLGGRHIAVSAEKASAGGDSASGTADPYVTQTTNGADDGGTPPANRETDMPAEGGADGEDNANGINSGEAVKVRKLITTVSIEAETEELDNILNRVQGEVTAMGGYVESSYISQDRTYTGNSNYSTRRRANLTLRVPEVRLDSILTTLSGETNVLEESRTTEDVTLTYVDIESRKKSLETQRDSLMRLLEQAETVEDIITIEDRLSYVNYEIENMGSRLRTYDNLVDYATLHLTLREVVEYTPVVEEPETIFTRISKGFSTNVSRVVNGMADFVVWLISSLPQIIVIAVAAFIAVKVIRAKKAHFPFQRRKAAVTQTNKTDDTQKNA